ncbi:MAG: succinate dehydrogenase cytochrome b subunit [Nannocystaceae bacterium]|nr:succinate dehydrogenase cytochrome b subunit [Myxococcales bacterium]
MSQPSNTGNLHGVLALLRSTIGLKVMMAVTGVILVGFVVQHMFGNLQVFAGREVFNDYAQFMQSLGAIKWGVRFLLIGCVLVHVWAAFHLARRNDEARPYRYHVPRKYRATTAAGRYMLFSGVVALLFIIYHILHFTIGIADMAVYDQWEVLMGSAWMPAPAGVDLAQLPADHVRHDAYGMFVAGFQKPVVALAYVVANTAIALHLKHATTSMFSTVGLSYGRYRRVFAPIGPAVGALIFLGNVTMPLAILAGVVTLHG